MPEVEGPDVCHHLMLLNVPHRMQDEIAFRLSWQSRFFIDCFVTTFLAETCIGIIPFPAYASGGYILSTVKGKDHFPNTWKPSQPLIGVYIVLKMSHCKRAQPPKQSCKFVRLLGHFVPWSYMHLYVHCYVLPNINKNLL